ncbi:FadR/GntR family transcriptional regulator [Bosea caraganae]|nr:FadR/GntR family transcriptional regulator [Bosea caraganae]
MSRPSSFHAHLVDRLGRMIVAGEIGRGGTLPREDELAQRFELSRTVIREATKTLQALGLIVTGPRVGSRIQPLSSWRLLDPQVMEWLSDADMASGFERDLLELRSMIEPAACAFAAERGSSEQVASIMAALAGMVGAPDRAMHEAADFRFHDAVLRASDNILLVQLSPILHAMLKASFRLSMHDPVRIQASITLHRDVANAIAGREPDQARAAMVVLLKSAQADIEQGRRRSKAAAARPTTRNPPRNLKRSAQC